jgi:glucose-6-phosphate 1-epimerase
MARHSLFAHDGAKAGGKISMITNSPDQLNSRFAIPGALRFEAGPGGLTRAVISTPAASGHVYLHGAHVTHYQPANQQPVLFLSSRSQFTTKKSIRGGVPICFPWFAAGKDDAAPIFHGFARTAEWSVSSVGPTDDGVELSLSLTSDDNTKSLWPYDFRARYTVRIGARLQLALEISNTGSKAFEFEEALHTYFQVADIRRAQISGLNGTHYLDKTQGMKNVPQDEEAVTFSGETDRIYLRTRSLCVAHDPAGERNIVVGNIASSTTVVWNPWSDKARDMADMGPDEWTKMLCIETCNVKDAAVTLQPGQSHTMTAIIGAENLSK